MTQLAWSFLRFGDVVFNTDMAMLANNEVFLPKSWQLLSVLSLVANELLYWV